MGEAIISRAGGSSSEGGGGGGSIIPGACNFILTLKTSKGTPVAGMKITCNDAGTLYNYSTNTVGKIAIPIKSGWANFSIPNIFDNGARILDQIGGWYNFDAAINTVCKKDAIYNGIANGTAMSLTNGNYCFWASKIINLDISGGGGGGGGSAHQYYSSGEWDRDWDGWGGSGGAGGRELININIENNTAVSRCYIGSGGGGGSGITSAGRGAVSGTSGGSGGSSSFMNITVGGGGGGEAGSVGYAGAEQNGSSGSRGSGNLSGASGGSRSETTNGSVGGSGDHGWCKIIMWT